jgi:hypothetical protein
LKEVEIVDGQNSAEEEGSDADESTPANEVEAGDGTKQQQQMQMQRSDSMFMPSRYGVSFPAELSGSHTAGCGMEYSLDGTATAMQTIPTTHWPQSTADLAAPMMEYTVSAPAALLGYGWSL